MRYTIASLSIASLIPILAYGAGQDFASFVGTITGIIDLLIQGIFALAVLAIVWGIIKAWVISGGEPEGVEQGKQVVLVGIIVLVIMISLWGILGLLRASIFQ